MNPGNFLRAVWPGEGFYCIAHPFTIPGSNPPHTVHSNKIFATMGEAISHVYGTLESQDVFFGVLPLKEAKVWDPTKVDYKTGEKGAWATRLQVNSLSSKCVFFDLDVGTAPGKYPTQQDAFDGLAAFVTTTGLPTPMTVSSGGGVHVYWLFDAPVAVVPWRDIAHYMKQLANQLGLKIDPTRTTDSSSVLRVAGTFNYKDRNNRRAVDVRQVGDVTAVGDFIQLVSDAMVKNGVTPGSAPVKGTSVAPTSVLGTQGFNDDFVAPTLKALLTACPQARKMLSSQGDKADPDYGPLDNTAWYRGIIGTFAHVEDGEELCRKITAKHPRTVADLEAKLVQTKGFAPARCDALPDILPWGEAPCLTCRFYKMSGVPNPLTAARRSTLAPAPMATSSLGSSNGAPGAPPPLPPQSGTIVVPPPLPIANLMAPIIPQAPWPYERLSTGEIAVNRKDKDGNQTQTIIHGNDIYPVRRLVNSETKTEQQVWHAVLPRAGVREFTLDADTLYDGRKFASSLSNQGIYPNKGDLSSLQDYMVAYIAQLQKDLDADTQVAHLGWGDGYRQFTMPDMIYLEDGSVKPTALTDSAKKSTQFIGRRGDETSQLALMHFYNRPEYIANQFAHLCSLASVIFYATGHHGVVVNMSGDSGASKSTTLALSAGSWGDPALWPINGTGSGATPKARAGRVMVNANLPTTVDEITHIPVKDANDLVMNISQPGHRLRLAADGSEKGTQADNYKSAIMISTANSSLHALLSTDNAAGTAGSMRVFEMKMTPQRVHSKAEADEFLRQLKQHFGHIGPRFLRFVVRNRVAVEKRVQDVMREIDIEGRFESSERFWSAVIATVLVSCEIAGALGLIPYDVAALRRWALEVQVPFMRGIVKEEYRDPLAVLQDYIAEKSGAILVVDKTELGANTGQVVAGANEAFRLNNVNGALLGHYDVKAGVLYLLKQGFKDYCSRIGATSTRILDDLNTAKGAPNETPRRVVTDRNTRKTIGAGTPLAKGQAWCFSVDMTHPDVAGVPLVAVVAAGGVPTSAPAGNLKAVI